MGRYFVYVIKSKEGLKYTGITENPDQRLKQHNDKTLSFWTKRGTDWNFIYIEEFVNNKDLYLFVGTTLQYHRRKAPNPFVIIGVFYPPKKTFQNQICLIKLNQ